MGLGIFYVVLGFLFAYVAYTNMGASIFEPITIILTLIAALDFFIGIKYIKNAIVINKDKK